jgi:hypothetical protein
MNVRMVNMTLRYNFCNVLPPLGADVFVSEGFEMV